MRKKSVQQFLRSAHQARRKFSAYERMSEMQLWIESMAHPEPTLSSATLSVSAIIQLFTIPVAAAISRDDDVRAKLFPEERAAASRWLPKRQRTFASGRHAARGALAALGYPPQELPRRPDGTLSWPAGTTGSITHCDWLCCSVAASRDIAAGIGVDAEGRKTLTDQVAHYILTSGEQEFRRSLPSALAELLPILVFSAKESFYKCYYPLTGTRLEVDDIAIDHFAPTSVATGQFKIAVLRPDLPLASRSRYFAGRYLITEHLVVTGVTLAAKDAPLGSLCTGS